MSLCLGVWIKPQIQGLCNITFRFCVVGLANDLGHSLSRSLDLVAESINKHPDEPQLIDWVWHPRWVLWAALEHHSSALLDLSSPEAVLLASLCLRPTLLREVWSKKLSQQYFRMFPQGWTGDSRGFSDDFQGMAPWALQAPDEKVIFSRLC